MSTKFHESSYSSYISKNPTRANRIEYKCSPKFKKLLNFVRLLRNSRRLWPKIGNHWYLQHIYIEDTSPWDESKCSSPQHLRFLKNSCATRRDPRFGTTKVCLSKCSRRRSTPKSFSFRCHTYGSWEIRVILGYTLEPTFSHNFYIGDTDPWHYQSEKHFFFLPLSVLKKFFWPMSPDWEPLIFVTQLYWIRKIFSLHPLFTIDIFAWPMIVGWEPLNLAKLLNYWL